MQSFKAIAEIEIIIVSIFQALKGNTLQYAQKMVPLIVQVRHTIISLHYISWIRYLYVSFLLHINGIFNRCWNSNPLANEKKRRHITK